MRNTRELGIITSIIFISLSIFVIAVDVPSLPGDIPVENIDTNVDIQFKEGWNLIGMYTLDDYLSELVENKSIEYVFLFDNLNKDYIQLAPERESGKLGSILGPGTKPGYYLNAGAWVYVEEGYNFTPQSIDDPVSIDVLQMGKGWNIFSITLDMIGKSLNDIKGECDITPAYLWDSENQEWVSMIDLMDDRNIFSNFGIGYGLILKVNEDCTLSTASTRPPAMPVRCEDDDGGLNYEQKGTTWSTKHLNSYGEVIIDNYYGSGDECCTKCDFTSENWVDTGNHTGYNDDKGKYLREGYCDDLGIVRFEKYECPNGCVNAMLCRTTPNLLTQ